MWIKIEGGSNNLMLGKTKTLAKLRKKVYIYDSNRQFVKNYNSVGFTVKDLRVGANTVKKYLDKDKLYKDKYFYSK